ncbi:aminopeptidase [Marinobacter sp. JSM 1782161]|uniref:aminopeptidase n=1 Tax=Marinobacter sp. JSM 1782161 TaxID=2685906 RepID=UPI001403DA5E|nr:aminopeptidase [Marinobacter sp. JSM 1782161]
MRQLSQLCLSLILVSALSGCQSVNYYQQAAGGQLSLWWNSQPIDELLQDPETPEALRRKLELVQRLRVFARDDLALPVGDTFSDFVSLDQPYVVYNLMVAPEFSLTPRQWCYPFVGCQSYRGYFHLEDARAARERYLADGDDTFLGGVTAYSTLGWFDDPVHTGFTQLPDDRMAALMFHELAHKQLYVANDTRFNESFATAVELEGLKRWLQATGQPEQYARTRARLRRRGETLALIEQSAQQLGALYAQQDTLDIAELRRRKQALLDELKTRYGELEATWGEPGPMAGVIEQVNNAVLGLFRQYNGDVPAFRQLLADTGGDFQAFYEQVERLSEAPADVRRQRLDALGQAFDEDL